MESPKSQVVAQDQGKQAGKQEKVLCFVSKKEVDRSSAKQIRHPKEGMVWVAEKYIK